MITYATNRERLTTSTAELNAMFLSGEGPATCVDDFVATTTASTFERLYSELIPELQEHVRGTAIDNIEAFDRIIAYAHEDGIYADGWVAFRDWTHRQPWLAEALSQPRRVTVSIENLELLGRRFGEQGAMLGGLRVERMRAKTDEERDEITRRIEQLEREFEKENAG